VLDYLVSRAAATRTKEGFYFSARVLEDLTRSVVRLLQEKGEIGVADLKGLTGTTRKYSIPLLEYLDGKRITVRKGDTRVLGPAARS
jgi:selenocysteine-specific elongation factor